MCERAFIPNTCAGYGYGYGYAFAYHVKMRAIHYHL